MIDVVLDVVLMILDVSGEFESDSLMNEVSISNKINQIL